MNFSRLFIQSKMEKKKEFKRTQIIDWKKMGLASNPAQNAVYYTKKVAWISFIVQ